MPISIKLRVAGPDDLAVINAIRRDAILGIPPETGLRDAQAWADKRSPEFYAERLAAGSIVIASSRGCPIGWGSSDDDRITGLYVRSSSGAVGVGRAIMSNLEVKILQRGHAYARLESSPNALGFYIKLGYSQIGPAEADGAIPMRRHLAAVGLQAGNC